MDILLDRFVEEELFFDYVIIYLINCLDCKISENKFSYAIFNFKKQEKV